MRLHRLPARSVRRLIVALCIRDSPFFRPMLFALPSFRSCSAHRLRFSYLENVDQVRRAYIFVSGSVGVAILFVLMMLLPFCWPVSALGFVFAIIQYVVFIYMIPLALLMSSFHAIYRYCCRGYSVEWVRF